MLNYRYNLKELLSALESAGELDFFVTDIFRFNLVCEENFGVRELLFDEHIARESKSEYFNQVFAGMLGNNFREFMRQLIENNDLPFYDLISRKFIELLGREKNSVFAEVLTAVDLTPEQQGLIQKELERLEDKKVYLHNIVSRNVLGGLVIKCGEKMLDLSLQSGLEQLKAALAV
ncbi:F0F1 ATP synthase subunit delta [Candidatus Termititenax persephonae]|uniref:ATP synthase subunit delta n=1 Tax=Candidatus Termititenax persephonae TaxID=2218525 RepID=A0A388TH51_9BACT|nr:F0F1 ATP synthase subunit delta [Candidatus Termititenax persephonae]